MGSVNQLPVIFLGAENNNNKQMGGLENINLLFLFINLTREQQPIKDNKGTEPVLFYTVLKMEIQQSVQENNGLVSIK